jgi:hypothetical protein
MPYFANVSATLALARSASLALFPPFTCTLGGGESGHLS